MADGLNLVTVEGKTYCANAEWPEAIALERAVLKTLDPKLVLWNGQTFKLWLENGNAAYTLAPDDDGKGDTLTLHRLFGSSLGSMPGNIAPPTLAIPEPQVPRIVVPDDRSTPLNLSLFHQANVPPIGTSGSGYGMLQALEQARQMGGFASELGPLGRALLGTTDPRQARDGTLYGAPVYANYTTWVGNPFVPPSTTPEQLRREMQAAQRKLMAEMETKLAAMQARAFTDAMTPAAEPSSGVWKKFLRDMSGFLYALGQLAPHMGDDESQRLMVMDMAGLRGCGDGADYYETVAPAELSPSQAREEVARTARAMVSRVAELQRMVDPAPTEAEAMRECDVAYMAALDQVTPGRMLRTADGLIHIRPGTELRMAPGDVVQLEYRIKGASGATMTGEETSTRTPNPVTNAVEWTHENDMSLLPAIEEHGAFGGNGEMGVPDD